MISHLYLNVLNGRTEENKDARVNIAFQRKILSFKTKNRCLTGNYIAVERGAVSNSVAEVLLEHAHLGLVGKSLDDAQLRVNILYSLQALVSLLLFFKALNQNTNRPLSSTRRVNVFQKGFQVLSNLTRQLQQSCPLALNETVFAQLSDPQCHYSFPYEMFMNSGCAVSLSRSRPVRSFHELMVFYHLDEILDLNTFQNQLWNTFRFYQDASACWQYKNENLKYIENRKQLLAALPLLIND